MTPANWRLVDSLVYFRCISLSNQIGAQWKKLISDEKHICWLNSESTSRVFKLPLQLQVPLLPWKTFY